MKQRGISEPVVPPAEGAIAPVEGEYALTVTAVYQDSAAHEWATEMWSRVTQLVGNGNIRVAWWSIGDLTQRKIPEDAAQSAIHADVIVIAVSTADVLPFNLRAWIDIWLPRRARGGALVALTGWPAGKPGRKTFDVQEYLRAVARQGGLDFFPQERMLPAAPSVALDTKAIPDAAGDATLAPTGTIAGGREHGAYLHWGLND